MRHIQAYQLDANIDFNSKFPGLPELLYRASSIDSILHEAKILNRIESVIPEDVLLESELNMLLNGGSAAVTSYHKGLAIGKNMLVENLVSSLPREVVDSFNALQSKFKKLTKEQKRKIFEDATAGASAEDLADFDNVMSNIESATDFRYYCYLLFLVGR